MDDYQPLWAEPIISTADMVAEGDRLLCPVVDYSAQTDYYEVLKRESLNGALIFTIEEVLSVFPLTKANRKIIKHPTDSVAYQKRLE